MGASISIIINMGSGKVPGCDVLYPKAYLPKLNGQVGYLAWLQSGRIMVRPGTKLMTSPGFKEKTDIIEEILIIK